MKHKRLSKKIVRIFAIKNPLPRVRTGGENIPQLNASSESVFATKLQAIRSIYIFKLGITNFGVEVELAAHSGRNASFAGETPFGVRAIVRERRSSLDVEGAFLESSVQLK